MPKNKEIKSILIIGSGPIVIGQACEFDYSGSQAAKALKKEGFRVILVNSNPATIMTDPEMAHATYIEPLTHDYIKKIIEIEKKLRKKEPTIPSTIKDELECNIFLRAKTLEEFSKLRDLKDNF